MKLLWSFIFVLASAALAHAQARSAPEGNSLPERTPASPATAMAEPPGARAPLSRAAHDRFARSLDLGAFSRLGVFDQGRAKIIETLAREHLNRIYGKDRWRDQSAPPSEQFNYDPVFTFLDLILNKAYYYDKPIIQVEALELRRAMVSQLSPGVQELWLRRGRLTPQMILAPETAQIIRSMETDAVLLEGVGRVQMALNDFDQTEALLNLVSPPPGSQTWSSLMDLRFPPPALSATQGASAQPGVLIAEPIIAQSVINRFDALGVAWRQADAAAANRALAELATAIPRLNPSTYPSESHRLVEHFYNATERFTLGYLGYLLGAITLLVAFATRRRRLIRAGVALLLLGFGVHTAGILVRMALSGRWPIHNQYESYIAISWLAVLVGMTLMFATRRWLYGAAAAALGAAALLFANTVAIPSREVGQVAGILATSRILYVHVHMVLASYGLISLGFFVSLFYLAVYYARGGSIIQFAATALGQVEMGAEESADRDPGAPGLPLSSTAGRIALLNDLDRAQLVVLQLAFWILGTGILMGAFWADHAWGRWWGWDPKETWALITWIIYLMVIHLRLGVKARGLVTAWMSVVGFCVMLWTYWGVNLLLAGLHSYA